MSIRPSFSIVPFICQNNLYTFVLSGNLLAVFPNNLTQSYSCLITLRKTKGQKFAFVLERLQFHYSHCTYKNKFPRVVSDYADNISDYRMSMIQYVDSWINTRRHLLPIMKNEREREEKCINYKRKNVFVIPMNLTKSRAKGSRGTSW